MPTESLPHALCDQCGHVHCVKADGNFWPHNDPKTNLLCVGCYDTAKPPNTKKLQRAARIRESMLLKEGVAKARLERARIDGLDPPDDWHAFMKKRMTARADGDDVD